MIIEATACDFEALLKGTAPRNLRVVPDGTIAPPDVLEMLSKLADEIRPCFAPSAWLIVGEDEVVGLCSIVRVPQGGDIHIGYGVAPARQGRGYTSRAIGELLSWGRADPRVVQISAETGVGNIASQRVLERNGFIRIGERVDMEDGPLICWRAITA
jgi:RimJ/RimL family protein N-acetyltransferase